MFLFFLLLGVLSWGPGRKFIGWGGGGGGGEASSAPPPLD